MSTNLDLELAEAVAGDEPVRIPLSHAGDGAPSPEARRANRRLLVGLLFLVGALATLVFFGIGKSAVYAVGVDDVLALPAGAASRKLRVQGLLVPGSLVKRDQPCEYRFRIEGTKGQLDVRYPQCVVPDSFVDRPEGGVEMTIEGALGESGSFEATQVFAKCASREGYKEYDPKTHRWTTPAQPK